MIYIKLRKLRVSIYVSVKPYKTYAGISVPSFRDTAQITLTNMTSIGDGEEASGVSPTKGWASEPIDAADTSIAAI